MTNEDLVYIVNAGNDPGISSMANDYSFPALAPLALGTWIQQRVPDVELIARDGAVRSNAQIIEEIGRLKPGLVGVSVLCTTYQNSLEIARAAKDSGSLVVFGNDQASQTSRAILENRPYVDFVVGHEYGELELEGLTHWMRGVELDLATFPSLTYRNDFGEVVGFDFLDPNDKKRLSIVHPESGYHGMLLEQQLSGRRKDALDIFPIPDRTLYPADHWGTYLENYLSRFADLHEDPVLGVTTMNRIRGCNRQGELQCKHCDMLLDISMSSPSLFWEEVRMAYDQVSATSFYECGDSLSTFPSYIKALTAARPDDLGFDPAFYVYTQALDYVQNPDLVKQLKELGVFRVNMGLETMSNPTLRHLKGPKDSVAINKGAIRLANSVGIHPYVSFVLGSEVETPETLAETERGVKQLIRDGLVAEVEVQPVLPLMNNYQGRVLQQHGMMEIEGHPKDWPIDVSLLSERYIANFSGVTPEMCAETAKRIRECAKENGINFGSAVSSARTYD